jgi:ABC-type transport system involved in cytochrome bd biosynthesis fused ATPase/permease subunit
LFQVIDHQNVTINSVPISEISYEYLVKNLALCGQKDQIFDFSILDNITFGHPYTDLEINEVIDVCNLEKFIYLAGGLDKKISAATTSFSGGEEKRLILARTLISKKPFIFLDEPLAGLDEQNRLSIAQKLSKYLKKYQLSCLVISHDESFDQYADQEIVYEKPL